MGRRRKPGLGKTECKIYFGKNSVLQVTPDVDKSGLFDHPTEFAIQLLAHAKDWENGCAIQKVLDKNKTRCIGLRVIYVPGVDETALKYYEEKAKEFCEEHGLKYYGKKLVTPWTLAKLLIKRTAIVLLVAARRLGRDSEQFKIIQKAGHFLIRLFRKQAKTGKRRIPWATLKKLLGLSAVRWTYKKKKKIIKLTVKVAARSQPKKK